MSEQFSGPNWDLSTEYTGFDDPALEADLKMVEEKIAALMGIARKLTTPGDPAAHIVAGKSLESDAWILLNNVETFAECILSVQADCDEALDFVARCQTVRTQLREALVPFRTLVNGLSDDAYAALLSREDAESFRFQLYKQRQLQPYQLDREQEALIESVQGFGLSNWGTLYTMITSNLKVQVDGQEKPIGLAQVDSILRGSDELARRRAYQAKEQALTDQRAVLGLALNNIGRWRTTLCSKRSVIKRQGFLDLALHSGHLSEATLNAMLATCKDAAPMARRFVAAKARALGKEQLDPWDLLAGPPESDQGENERWTFDRAISAIADALTAIHPDMGQFVHMMVDNGWVEAGSEGQRAAGAYCTGFPKNRTPRVYMTFEGRPSQVVTLAHELGHAYHGWMLRDAHYAKRAYPMTLAETASIFTQTVFSQHLIAQSGSQAERFSILWNEAEDASALLLNIPVRFQFEKALYQRFEQGVVGAEELCDLMADTWNEVYQDSFSQPDRYFWASKLHFFITSIPFYNFPYTFGYLFSLGILARQEAMGDGFFELYNRILADTGVMEVEELADKHLGVDLTQPEFWQGSIRMVEAKLAPFEEAVDRLT